MVGAGDGATLGALWLNSEYHRYRYLPPAAGLPQGQLDHQNPEGLAVKAAIWLSMSPTLGTIKTPLNLLPMLDGPTRGYKVPTLFVSGEGDSKGGDFAKKLTDKLVPAKAKKDYPNTATLKIAGAEQMTGKNLLLESLETTDKVLKFLEAVPESKMAAKGPRKTSEETFYWEVTPGTQPIMARKKGADRVEFADYSMFMR